MECADNATFNHGPKTVNGIGMNRTADIFALAMMDHTMVTPGIKMPVTGVIIGRDQAYFMRNGLIHEAVKGLGVNIINDLSHDLAATANSADNGGLTAWPTPAASLVLVLVLGFAAYKGFVNFHKANELAKFGIVEASPDTVTHRPCSAIRACADHPMNLQGTHAFLATQHKVDYLEPNLQGIIRILKNCSHQDRETITTGRTTALPVPIAAKFIDLIATAPWTPYAIRPAPGSKIGFAGVLSRKFGFKFCESHLSGGLGFHRKSPLSLDDYQDNTSETLCQEVDNRLYKGGLSKKFH
jgi:hypothetical protein